MMNRWAITIGLITLGMPLLRAQDPEDLKRGVARISFINGEVSVQRGDSQEWVAATLNAPLLTGDRITTAPNSRAEVEFESGSILRMGGEAVITVSDLEYGRYQLAVGRGTINIRIPRASSTDIEVDTPSVSVRPSKVGTYRISVTDAGESEITARAGDVEVFTPRGSQWVYSGQTMLARGTASDPEFQIATAIPYDDWDRWCDSRDRQLAASTSYQYVPPGVYGAEDLDPYGAWVNVPTYGYVWRPVVAAGWAPYRYGRWVWEDWYGWTWVSSEPWGWAPYHFGRWFFEPAYGWCWYPGALGVRHYWSPALVAFFGFGGGVSFGFANVGWVPLAPYEVLHPWWGRGFYGRSEYFNRPIKITNVNIYETYRNARATNGFTAVSGSDFRSGRFSNFLRPSGADLRQVSFARGPIPIAPQRATLRYSERESAYVPRTLGANRVFSYRQPAPAQRLPVDRFNQEMRSNPLPEMSRRDAGNEVSGGLRFGATGTQRQRAVPPASAPMPRNDSSTVPRNEAGGWQRFGEPRTFQPGGYSAANPAPSRVVSPSGTAGGWSRFGEPMGTRGWGNRQPPANYGAPVPSPVPNERFNPAGRSETLRVVPPVVRQRPNSGPGFAAPRSEMRSFGGFGGFSRQQSGGGGGSDVQRPSGGFGAARPSGGGSFGAQRPSGGGGGGPRNERGGGGGHRGR